MWIYKIGTISTITMSQAERENNAKEIYNFFSDLGFTLEAICGMLGNMEHESWLNPGMKQTVAVSSGWGLIQWTPSSVLTNWCTSKGYNWYDGYAQCTRINREGNNESDAKGYWLPTSAYSYTWSQFSKLTDVTEATKAFLYERERAGVSALNLRIEYAIKWYDFFGGETPIPPTPPTPPSPKTRRKMPIYMMVRRR